MKRWFSLFCLVLLVGCGSAQDLARTEATLVIGRQLAERLRSIEVYLFETSANRPRCDELSQPSKFPVFNQSAEQKLEINYPQVNTAIFDDIPDHGMVWRFYARGFDSFSTLIAQGCNTQLYRIEAGKTLQLEIELLPYP